MSPVAHNGELTLVYETHGDPDDPALLLVSGYTRQLIGWPVEFVDGLTMGGRFVITYDNRDCGLSSKLPDQTVDLPALAGAAGAGDFARARELAPYTLSDMAGDGVAVLDALGVTRAHVLGVSMGGMIAQTIAIEHPDRVLSLVSIMSRTGEPGYGDPSPEAAQVIMASSSRRAAGSTPPTSFPARGCCSWTTWATTCRSRSSPTSAPRFSPTPPDAVCHAAAVHVTRRVPSCQARP